MNKTLKQSLKNIYRINETLLSAVLIVFLFDYLLFPYPILAKELNSRDQFSFILAKNGQISEIIAKDMPKSIVEADITDDKTNIGLNTFISEKSESGNDSQKMKAITIKHGVHLLTAYSSEVAQTDASPCITANGFNLCKHGKEDTIAANFLKFNTKVKIPELFGDRVFVVRDRMNKRHQSRVDVWMIDRADALKFGVKLAKIEILEEK